ncbi:MAG: hypothetical protein B7Y39_15100 [Bdellovibrio sp. 28-41-41]|nr:MAG: hypothetical protein B7Y39_15100 [Bdellovibrio sp. 28-41-41]
MKTLQLEEKYLTIVKSILDTLNVKASAFGSRAKNKARVLSDLDLCLLEDYDKTTVRRLQDAFEESDLPFKVDVVVWSDLSDSFKKQIQDDFITV